MAHDNRRTWRAASSTLTVVVIFVLATVVAIPVLAYLSWTSADAWAVPALLGVLTLLALGYAWRFGLHPRLLADEAGVTVVNPFSRSHFEWEDLRVIAPGENGLVLASTEAVAEAWCVQKSRFASRRGRSTRADRVTDELFTLLEQHDPPWEDEETGLRIRRARPEEARLLTRLEQAASEQALSEAFPPEQYPYPVAEVARRWHRLLRDPQVRTYLLEHGSDAVGFVAFDSSTLRHLGVLPEHARRGYGTALAEFATQEIFDEGAASASLWVLAADAGARAFSARLKWQETPDRRDGEFPPASTELRLERRNPAAPRRGR